eukprot:766343-Hanusia_phi.AAC.1
MPICGDLKRKAELSQGKMRRRRPAIMKLREVDGEEEKGGGGDEDEAGTPGLRMVGGSFGNPGYGRVWEKGI